MFSWLFFKIGSLFLTFYSILGIRLDYLEKDCPNLEKFPLQNRIQRNAIIRLPKSSQYFLNVSVDPYSIAWMFQRVDKLVQSVVGHMPQETSRFVWFFYEVWRGVPFVPGILFI